jgi:hypothetical protein
MVHSSGGNLVEVIGSNEAAPVSGKNTSALVLAQGLTKRPLVHSGITSCVEN